MTDGDDREGAVPGGEDTESTVTNGEDGEGAVPGGEDTESTVTNGEEGESKILDGGDGGPTAAGRRKMLLWGGVGGVLLIAAVAVVVVVVLIMRGGSLPGGPLGLVPDDASWLRVVDVERLLTGDAPDDSADDFEDEWEDRLDDIGVSLDDLKTLVQAQGDDGTVLAFGGDLDFEQIRDELEDARYDDDDYQGYVVWDDGDLWVEAAALLDGRGEVVIGSTDAVEDVLKALSRGSRSLLQDDDNDLRRVLERAGQGWVLFALEGCQGTGVRGCEAVGAAVSEGSESYLVETTFAYLFRNERTAESELEDLEDYLDDEFSPGRGHRRCQNGRRVRHRHRVGGRRRLERRLSLGTRTRTRTRNPDQEPGPGPGTRIETIGSGRHEQVVCGEALACGHGGLDHCPCPGLRRRGAHVSRIAPAIAAPERRLLHLRRLGTAPRRTVGQPRATTRQPHRRRAAR